MLILQDGILQLILSHLAKPQYLVLSLVCRRFYHLTFALKLQRIHVPTNPRRFAKFCKMLLKNKRFAACIAALVFEEPEKFVLKGRPAISIQPFFTHERIVQLLGLVPNVTRINFGMDGEGRRKPNRFLIFKRKRGYSKVPWQELAQSQPKLKAIGLKSSYDEREDHKELFNAHFAALEKLRLEDFTLDENSIAQVKTWNALRELEMIRCMGDNFTGGPSNFLLAPLSMASAVGRLRALKIELIIPISHGEYTDDMMGLAGPGDFVQMLKANADTLEELVLEDACFITHNMWDAIAKCVRLRRLELHDWRAHLAKNSWNGFMEVFAKMKQLESFQTYACSLGWSFELNMMAQVLDIAENTNLRHLAVCPVYAAIDHTYLNENFSGRWWAHESHILQTSNRILEWFK